MNDESDSPRLELADPELADLVERLTAALQAGQPLDLQDCLRQYPEHAARLGVLWPALRALAEAGRDVEQDLHRAGKFDQLGQVLGDYRIVRPLGRGGMGVVYEAVQESLGRHVALKVLPLHRAGNPTWLERFKREAQAAARLHHTNIVPVFGVGEDQGRHFYAMQFIPGKGLDVFLEERRAILEGSSPHLTPAPETSSLGQGSNTSPQPAPAGEIRSNRRVRTLPGKDTLTGLASQQGDLYFRNVARIGLQVAEALEHAHAQGVLHRDIKPSNLLLDQAGVVWVTDFGLARLEGAAELTTGDAVLGTLRYMAPERFQGRSDARGDIYSLGATLYELLTLRPVVEDIDPLRVVEQVGRSSPTLPRKLNPNVPRDLETIVLKALDPCPESRYATAGDMVEELRRFLADLPILARRLPWWERLARWRRHNPSLAAALLLALLTSLTAAIVAGLFAVHKTHDARQLQDKHAEVERKRAESAAALEEARKHLRLRQHFERQAAILALEKGLRLGEAGKGHLALLWLARALELYPGGDPTLEEAIRLNLSAWSKRLRPLLHRLEHHGSLRDTALSPDGLTVAACTQEGDVYFWDVETGRLLAEPLRRFGQSLRLGFSPTGKTLLVGGLGKAQLFNARTGKPAGPLFQGLIVDNFLFNAEGDRVLILRRMNQAQLWDPFAGKPLSPLLRFTGLLVAAAFSNDGKKVMVASAVIESTPNTSIELSTWDALNGVPIGQPLRLYQKPSREMGFTLDRTQLVTCSTADGSVRVWNVATGQQVKQWKAPVLHNASRLVLAPNCQAVAVQDRNRLALLGPTGSLLHNRIVLPSSLTVVGFSGDSRLLLTGTDASDCAVAQLWDAATGMPMGESVAQDAPVQAIHLTADGRRLLTVDGQTIRIWGAEPTTDRVCFPGAKPYCCAYSRDGRLALVLTKDGLILWDVVRDCEAGWLPVHPTASITAALSDDARVVALIEALQARVWHRHEREPRWLDLSVERPIAIDLSRDGQMVCTASQEGRIQLWNAATGELLRTTPRIPLVLGLHFTADGQAVRFWARGGLYKLEREKATITRLFRPDIGASIIAVSPDGQRLLLTQGERAWLQDLGRQTRHDLRQELIVRSAHFSADGRVVLAAGQCPRRNRPLLRMWDATTGQPRGQLLEMPHLDTAYPGPDGTFALVRVSSLDYHLIHFPSGQAIGPLIRHSGSFQRAAFAPDGKTVLTTGGFHVWLTRVPRPLAGDAKSITAHVQALTGLELNEHGQARATGHRK